MALTAENIAELARKIDGTVNTVAYPDTDVEMLDHEEFLASQRPFTSGGYFETAYSSIRLKPGTETKLTTHIDKSALHPDPDLQKTQIDSITVHELVGAGVIIPPNEIKLRGARLGKIFQENLIAAPDVMEHFNSPHINAVYAEQSLVLQERGLRGALDLHRQQFPGIRKEKPKNQLLERGLRVGAIRNLKSTSF